MCRLAAFIGDMRMASPYIESFRGLAAQNPHGWGLGAFVDGEAKLVRSTVNGLVDPAFGKAPWLDDAPSAIMHLRKATVGDVSLVNTHPFHVGENITAHNGTFGAVDTVEEKLGADMHRLGVRGDTDSERFAALLASELEKSGGDEVEAYRRTAAYLSDHHPMTSITSITMGKDGDLYALRYPENRSLFWKRVGVRDATRGHSLIVPFSERRQRAVTVFASRPLDATEGWQELPPGKLLRVRAGDLREEMFDVMDVEPRVRYTDPHMDAGMSWEGRRRSVMLERQLSA
jgi:glutamine amidotransferase